MPFTNRREVDTVHFGNGHGNGNGNGNSRRVYRPDADMRRSLKSGRPPKQGPPENTNAESFYYLKQMNAKTPMVIVLTDGEQIQGCIEWYDKNALKVNREGAPNLLIQRHCIKYLFKQEEA